MKITLKPGEKLSVLVADDEIDIRETLVTFLEMMECFSSIVQASNGAEAFFKVQNQEFDFIITDLMMPKVRGIELIQNINREDIRKKRSTPIMILSANVTGEEFKQAIHFGVKYVMTKPCTAEQFVQKVSEVIRKEFRNKVRITKS